MLIVYAAAARLPGLDARDKQKIHVRVSIFNGDGILIFFIKTSEQIKNNCG